MKASRHPFSISFYLTLAVAPILEGPSSVATLTGWINKVGVLNTIFAASAIFAVSHFQ